MYERCANPSLTSKICHQDKRLVGVCVLAIQLKSQPSVCGLEFSHLGYHRHLTCDKIVPKR